LLTYHKAKGLCFKCGDKWSKGHTCPAQVPLQVVEEMMMAIQQSGSALPNQSDDSDSDEGMELLEVQEVKDQNTPRRRKPSMRLLGYSHEIVGVHWHATSTDITGFRQCCNLHQH
jgi:hypothetical protein